MTTKTKTNTETKNLLDFTKKISIRQFCNPEYKNMGLENYNLSLFSGANGEGGIKEDLGYRQIGGKRIYLTGLDVNADYLNDLPNEVKETKILEIEAVVKHLEQTFGKGTLDPLNGDFWKDQYIEIKRPVVELDLSDTKDLITYYCILGGGYSEIAPSYTAAKLSSGKVYKFYLHQDEEVSDNKVQLTKMRNKATVILEEIDNEDPVKLFKMAKVLLPIEKSINNKTPKTQIYSDLNEYIYGMYSKNDMKQAPRKFIEVSNLDRATLNVTAIVKESLHQRFLVRNESQIFFNPQTQISYGRNESEIIAFLMNPVNGEELNMIGEKVNRVWS